MRKVLVSAGLLLSAVQVSAGVMPDVTYNYYPDTALRLGRGVDPNNPTATKRMCLNPKELPVRDRSAHYTNAQLKFVRDTFALKAHLGIDGSADASLLVFKGSSKYSFNSDFALNTDNVNIVVQGDARYEPVDLSPEAELSPSYRQLIVRGRMDEFASQCGTHYITSETRGARISVIIQIAGLSVSQKLDFDLSMKGSGGIGPVSAKASQHINTMLSTTADHTSVSISVIAQGGDGLPSFDKLVTVTTNPKSLEEITNAINKVLRELTFEKSAPLAFHAVKFGFGFDPNFQTITFELKKDKLLELAERYRLVLQRHNEAKMWFASELDEYAEGQTKYLSGIYDEIISDAYSDIPKEAEYLKQIAKAHERCLQAKDSFEELCILPQRVSLNNLKILRNIMRGREATR